MKSVYYAMYEFPAQRIANALMSIIWKLKNFAKFSNFSFFIKKMNSNHFTVVTFIYVLPFFGNNQEYHWKAMV